MHAVIVLLGTNDIGWPGGPFAPNETPVQLQALTQGFEQLVAQAPQLCNQVDSLGQQYDGLKVQLAHANSEVKTAKLAEKRAQEAMDESGGKRSAHDKKPEGVSDLRGGPLRGQGKREGQDEKNPTEA